jgi:hypothetical protein
MGVPNMVTLLRPCSLHSFGHQEAHLSNKSLSHMSCMRMMSWIGISRGEATDDLPEFLHYRNRASLLKKAVELDLSKTRGLPGILGAARRCVTP